MLFFEAATTFSRLITRKDKDEVEEEQGE